MKIIAHGSMRVFLLPPGCVAMFTKKLPWGMEQQVTVAPSHRTTARLVVEEKHYVGDFEQLVCTCVCVHLGSIVCVVLESAHKCRQPRRGRAKVDMGEVGRF